MATWSGFEIKAAPAGPFVFNDGADFAWGGEPSLHELREGREGVFASARGGEGEKEEGAKGEEGPHDEGKGSRWASEVCEGTTYEPRRNERGRFPIFHTDPQFLLAPRFPVHTVTSPQYIGAKFGNNWRFCLATPIVAPF